MVVTCQACGAANDDQARFCDQCGAALNGALTELDAPIRTDAAPGPATVPAPVQPSGAALPGINWAGLCLIAIVLCGLGFLFFGKPGDQSVSPAAPPNAAGGATDPGATFQQAQAQLKEYKDRLAKDALDVEALSGMYSLYAQIGQAPKVREQLHASLDELRRQVADKRVSTQDAIKSALDMAMAAMSGDDALGAVDALIYYYELNPQRVSTAAMIANIYYDIGMPEPGLEWYDKYLAAADPDKEG